ncbi:MAG: TetR-like C-terminal domain-containing protein, partial [Chloroflexota bacterium]
QAAAAAQDDGTAASRILAASIAYREWAVMHPVQFQLIYGNPIPNYVGPVEVIAPVARLPFEGIFRDFAVAYHMGELEQPQQHIDIPLTVRANIDAFLNDIGLDIPYSVMYAIMSSWSHIHGMVMLELFNHITPVIKDTEAFYQHEIISFLQVAGVKGLDTE